MAGIPEESLNGLLKLCHERGMHVWGCHSYLAHLLKSTRGSTESLRREQWDRYMKRWEQFLLKYKDVPTFLAFEIGEEPYEWTLPYILEARQLMAKVGSQPQLMLYNNPDVLRQDCATAPLPAGACMDSYVFLKLHTRKDRYIAYLQATWDGARTCGGAAWFTPQLIGGRLVYLTPSRAEMRFQVWAALAYNVKGFFPWAYGFAKKPDFSDQSYYRDYADEMGRLASLEKLIVAMERRDELQLLDGAPDHVLVGCFEDRNDPAFRFAVAVNTNTDAPASVALKPVNAKDAVWRVAADAGAPAVAPLAAGEQLRIEPGDGVVLFVGGAERASSLLRRYWP